MSIYFKGLLTLETTLKVDFIKRVEPLLVYFKKLVVQPLYYKYLQKQSVELY